MQALEHLRAAGIQVSVNTQINRLSMPQLHEVLDDLIRNDAHSWQLQLTVAMGRASDEPEVLLQPYDLLELFPLLSDLKDRCDQEGVRMWPGNNLGYFGPYESKLRGGMPRGHMASCGAGRLTLGIEADGTIKGCPSLSEDWSGGNIRDYPLVDIWEQPSPFDIRETARSMTYGAFVEAVTTLMSAAQVAPGPEVLFDRPGNNLCHHRALERERAGCVNGLCASSLPRACPSITDFSKWSWNHRIPNSPYESTSRLHSRASRGDTATQRRVRLEDRGDPLNPTAVASSVIT